MFGSQLSMVAVAAAMLGAVVVAHPYPECEECASVSKGNLEALDIDGKVLTGGVHYYMCVYVWCVAACTRIHRGEK